MLLDAQDNENESCIQNEALQERIVNDQVSPALFPVIGWYCADFRTLHNAVSSCDVLVSSDCRRLPASS